MRRISPIALALALVACGDTGQREVNLPIFGSGRAPQPFAVGEWQVTLELARVGLGPIYFCASEAASADLCPAAVAELAASAAVDALDATPQRLGEVFGVTGEIRSATYDYAITWFPTQLQPTPTAAAPGGHSARFEGRATRGATTFRFVADVDVLPILRGSRAVQGARVTAQIRGANLRVDVRLDPSAWFRAVDFEELSRQGVDPVAIRPGSAAHNALVIGMTASALPTFEWSEVASP